MIGANFWQVNALTAQIRCREATRESMLYSLEVCECCSPSDQLATLTILKSGLRTVANHRAGKGDANESNGRRKPDVGKDSPLANLCHRFRTDRSFGQLRSAVSVLERQRQILSGL